jgi:PAS domain S-box-containing protein
METYLHHILHSIHAQLWIFNENEEIIECANTHEPSLNLFSHEEIIGKHHSGFLPLELSQKFEKELQALKSGQEFSSFQYHSNDPDNLGIFQVEISRIKHKDQNQFISTIRKKALPSDISPTLKNFEPIFKSLYENAPIGVALATPDGIPFKINPALCKILGYPEEEIVGRHFKYYTFKDDVEKNLALSSQLIRGEITCYQLEKRYIRKDGTLIWANLTVSSVKDENDNIEFIIAMVGDIQKRRAIEEDLQTYFDLSNDALVIADFSGKLQETSRALSKMLGYDQKTLSNTSFIDFVHPDDVQKTIDIFAENKAGKPGKYFINRYKKKDGNYIWVEWNSITKEDKIYAIARDITERKSNEELLKESEKRWKFALESAQDGIWELDLITNQIFVSKNIFPLLGYENQEEVSQLDFWKNKIHIEDLQPCLDAFQAYQNGNTQFFFCEIRVRTNADQYKWLLTKGKIIKWNEENTPLKVIGVVSDISSQKAMEVSLRESEQKFKAIFDTTFQLLGLMSTNGTILEVSNRTVSFTQLPYEKMIGKKIWEINLPFKEFQKEQFMEDIRKAAKGEFVRHELEVTIPGKQTYTLDFSITPITDESGEVSLLIPEGHNITERKAMEQTLHESKKKFQNIFNYSPVGIVLTDLETGSFIEVNQAFLDRTQYTESDFKSFSYQHITPIQYKKKDLEQLEKIKKEGKFGPYEKEITIKSGEKVPFLINGFVVTDKNGKQLVWSILQDISIIKEKERKIKQLNKELQESNLQKDKLFSIISHDLKGPIERVNTFLGMMLQKKASVLNEDFIVQLLPMLKKGVEEAGELLDELLLWARSQFEMISIEKSQIRLKPILNKTLNQLKLQSELKQIHLQIRASDEVTAFADPNMIYTVIRNLVSNAIKFSYSGGHVHINAYEENDHTVISVKDSGIGIKPDNLEKIFKKDTPLTTPGTKGEKGSGLGLTLCKDFVERHKGKIWVQSTPGQGACFYVQLPKA